MVWCSQLIGSFLFFFFNDTATTEIYTLSLHDALPISIMAATSVLPLVSLGGRGTVTKRIVEARRMPRTAKLSVLRSEEHTSELQSRQYLVCRLLLEKKKKYTQWSLTLI